MGTSGEPLTVDETAVLRWHREWQNAVVAEVLTDARLPCDPCEVSIEDVPALLAVMSGRIEHADDYEGPPTIDPAELEPAKVEP